MLLLPSPPLSFGPWASAYWPRPALHYLKCGNFLATETYFATHIADAPWELPSNQWLKGVDVINNPGPWAADPLQQFNLCSSTLVAGLTKLCPPPPPPYWLLSYTPELLPSSNWVTSLLPYLCFLHLLNKPLALEYLSQLCYWRNPNYDSCPPVLGTWPPSGGYSWGLRGLELQNAAMTLKSSYQKEREKHCSFLLF